MGILETKNVPRSLEILYMIFFMHSKEPISSENTFSQVISSGKRQIYFLEDLQTHLLNQMSWNPFKREILAGAVSFKKK